MSFEIRSIEEPEFSTFRAIDRLVFGDPEVAAGDELDRTVFDLSRTRAAFANGKMVGTLGTFGLQVSIPSGTLPMAGTTCVAVLPTHRRQGVLTALMRAHLDEVRQRGEPMAALWASEGGIYRRFGYGMATHGLGLEFDSRELRWRADLPAGRSVELLLDRDSALAVVPKVFEAAAAQRPGIYHRSETWWRNRTLLDDPARRRGGSQFRYLVTTGDDGKPDGFAYYRQRNGQRFGEGHVDVQECIATSPGASAALWRVLASIDLFPHVSYWNASLDDPLPWLVTDSFRIRKRIIDGLWLRPLDIETTFAARRYAHDGALVLEVKDPYYPDVGGRFELQVNGGVGLCTRSTEPADLALDAATLGSLYLGAQPVSSMVAAGLIRCRPSIAQRAQALFGWDTVAWCSEVF